MIRGLGFELGFPFFLAFCDNLSFFELLLPIPQNQAGPLLHVLLAIFKTKTAKTTDTSICISLSVKENSRLATSTFMV